MRRRMTKKGRAREKRVVVETLKKDQLYEEVTSLNDCVEDDLETLPFVATSCFFSSYILLLPRESPYGI